MKELGKKSGLQIFTVGLMVSLTEEEKDHKEKAEEES